MMKKEPSDTSRPKNSASAPPPREIASETLFGERREVWIEHRGEMYRLRITSTGKLCLTK